jgi:hypothetical protein
MQATRSDVFALKNAGLDAFLYADVGAEVNGSTLTTLSVLARLGKDPWAEAARWATLPKAAVIESLAQSITQMPLVPSGLAGARDSAARLVQLLPTNTQSLRQIGVAKSETATLQWVLLPILYFAFAGGMMLAMSMISKPSSDVPAQIAESAAVPTATHPATRLLRKGVAVAATPVAPTRQ